MQKSENCLSPARVPLFIGDTEINDEGQSSRNKVSTNGVSEGLVTLCDGWARQYAINALRRGATVTVPGAGR